VVPLGEGGVVPAMACSLKYLPPIGIAFASAEADQSRSILRDNNCQLSIED
jgi:hypothetical protein